MAEDSKHNEQVVEAVESAEVRRVHQDERDPSGHGMQVTPRQQQHIAESSTDAPEAAAEIDEQTLEDLKADDTR